MSRLFRAPNDIPSHPGRRRPLRVGLPWAGISRPVGALVALRLRANFTFYHNTSHINHFFPSGAVEHHRLSVRVTIWTRFFFWSILVFVGFVTIAFRLALRFGLAPASARRHRRLSHYGDFCPSAKAGHHRLSSRVTIWTGTRSVRTSTSC